MTTIDFEDLTEDEIRRVVESEFFQKGVKYRRLADGLEVLEDDGVMYDKLVTGILSRQSRIQSRETVEQVLEAFVEEVEHYVDVVEEDEQGELDDLLRGEEQ
jgi:hypothetical protein